MRKSRVLQVMIAMVVFFSFCVVSYGAESIVIKIDDKVVSYDEASGYPFVDENGRTLVPFEATFGIFGAEIAVEANYECVICEKYGIDVEVPVGEKFIMKDDVKIASDTNAVIMNEIIYIPIRNVMEAFGCEVSWIETSQTVEITSP